ncbi:MAG: hypothetical protein Q9224_000477, partial [Gallowayella concinna]
MGAIHKHDLTSDVTHLIVGDTDTPKYKFVAKERPDVKCLLPAWVEALRESWMEGGEPDVQALESRYTLPALYNLRVCVTVSYRKRLEDLVRHNGGEYRANLTKDVTHLIARETTGAKYKYAMDWKIKIVAAEWLDQSLERGMILDEKLYTLSTPSAERGCNAWSRRTLSTTSLGKRAFDGDVLLNGPRKLRRLASTKLSSQNVGLWTDIVSHDSRTEELRHDQWSEQLVSHGSSFQGGSFTDVKSEPTGTAMAKAHSKTTVMTSVTPLAPPMVDPPQIMGIFAGKKLYLHGFNEKKYISPSDSVTNTPFPTFPIPGFEHLTICSTGFEGVDLLHMSRAAKLMGATYDEEFTSKASVLVCQAVPSYEKLRHAQHWNIPTVTADWLWDCITSGRYEPLQPYFTQPYPARPVPEAREQALDQAESNRQKSLDAIGSNGLGIDALAPRDVKHGKTKTDTGSPIDDPTSHDSLAATEKSTLNPPPPADHSNPSLPYPIHRSPSPVHEIAPNASPPKSSISHFKPTTPTETLPSESTLSSAISSLLAHHQNARSSVSSTSYSHSIQASVRSNVRRKRQLLGRAPSNASNFSRASSVDTVNTDGVGTPVDPTHPVANNKQTILPNSSKSISNTHDAVFDPLSNYD